MYDMIDFLLFLLFWFLEAGGEKIKTCKSHVLQVFVLGWEVFSGDGRTCNLSVI